MSEQKIPIPAMLYNAAVGGHVTNSQQIIDENLNREQNDINQETVGAVPYNSTTPNGMGRIVLKKNDNFKQVVEAQTGGNTIFVIKYDFTLTGNVTVPANCVLKFDGGSVSGNYTVTGANTGIRAGLVKIFNTDISFFGTWNVVEAYPEWFGAKGDGVADDTNAIQKCVDLFKFTHFSGTYNVTNTIILQRPYSIISGGSIIKTNSESDYDFNAIFAIKHASISIRDMGLTGDVANGVRGIVFDIPAHLCSFYNLTFHHFEYCFYAYKECFMENFTRILCRSSVNAFGFNSNIEKTSLQFNNCWCENCGQAYDFKNTTYSNLSCCGADLSNYTDSDNPYGEGFGSKSTNKGIYNFENSGNIGIYNCGAEGGYGNGVVKFALGCTAIINGLTVTNIKSEYQPPYTNYPNWGVGVINTDTEITILNISTVKINNNGFINTYVRDNYPTKSQSIIAFNYNYGDANSCLVLYSGISNGYTSVLTDISGVGNVGRNCYNLARITKIGYDFKAEHSLVIGNYVSYGSKVVTASSASNTLVIPFTSQENEHRVGVIEIIGLNNVSNTNDPKAFKTTIAFDTLTSVNNVSVIEKSNEAIAATASSTNLLITLPYSYTNLLIKISLLENNYIQIDNISLQ